VGLITEAVIGSASGGMTGSEFGVSVTAVKVRATIAFLARQAWLGLAVLLAVVVELGLALNPGAPSTVDVVCGLVATLPLALARRYPFPVLVAVVGALAVGVSVGERTHDGLAVLALFPATYAVGRHAVGRLAWAGLVVSVGGSALALALGPDSVVSDYPIVLTLFGLAPWAAGRAVRVRHRQAARLRDLTAELEREQEARTRAAAAGERVRIARELHDVISHSVSLIAVQAGAAGRVIDAQPAAAREALGTIERTARDTLGELRRLLGILREHDGGAELASPPGLARLDELVEQARTAGLPVDLRVAGAKRPLSPGVDLTAYRIVQEALTNARKHAGNARAAVRIRYAAHEIEIEIVDDGRGTVARNGEGSGLGLVGMRERVALYDGRLEAGARDTGGYRVHAVLPLEQS
jgi:signal transduction histidine kinase